ncbi:MAG: deoxyribonuclease IV [Desulfobacteraceae bacterium]|nr:deoxyribonuclease IV [Desulfobacteraceae bacterium]MCF8095340.1 deoxyribonuclease IV [Desulfobacteraceae bacterium]
MNIASSDKQSGELILGAHLSISGGLYKALEEAESLGCKALQIFTKNASTWREKTLSREEIGIFEEARKKTGIRSIAAHSAYLINLAAKDPDIRKKSRAALKQELVRCGQLGLPWLVLHAGFHMGEGEKTGIKRIVGTINHVFKQLPENPTRLLLETTAGQGTSLGSSFKQLAEMMHGISNKNRVGICMDTCHIFAAGYDISSRQSYMETMKEFDMILGINNLYVIHVNDALKQCGSRVDRHAHIGEGMIGSRGFSSLVNDPRLSKIPKILETPKKKDGKNMDPENIARLRALYLT